MAIKKRDYEKLDDANIERVIAALNDPSPITKKSACEMLNISYNTTRLGNIIDDYIQTRDYRLRRLEQNRYQPATIDEKREIISDYLAGRNITEIARDLYRPTSFVKNFVNKLGVPTKVAGFDEFIVPDECVKYEFDVGEWVWFNDSHPDIRGGKAGQIKREVKTNSGREGGYKVYEITYWVPIVWKEGMWKAWWPGVKRFPGTRIKRAYEIASIQHLIDKYEINYEVL